MSQPKTVPGRIVVISFLLLLLTATAGIYWVVVSLKMGGAEALRENKERRVPEAAGAPAPPR